MQPPPLDPDRALVFFFFKQKTAYEIKECDWSSDVCSSDLRTGLTERQLLAEYERTVRLAGSDELPFATQVGAGPRTAQVTAHATDRAIEDGDIVRSDTEIGRA